MADDVRRIIAEFSAKNKAKGEMASFQRDMDNTGQAMKRMATSALAAAGLGGGIYAVKRVFDYVTKAAMKQEDAVFLLEAALKSAGEYTDEGMKGFEAFAASIQKATVYGDEEVLSLMQLMTSLGVTSNKLEQATRMAIGLAAATGRDVRSMSMYIALAQQGEFTMLRRYIPALRSTTDATEQLRIITEFAARGFKTAEAQAETTSGALRQMWNAVSDLAEAMAEPYLEPAAEDIGLLTILIEGATKALNKYQDAWEKVRESREKFGLRPMGFPRVPMPDLSDLEEKFERWETPTPLIPVPELIHFEDPGVMAAFNAQAEAQEKASITMYEMMMKARGLGDELARQKSITEYAALATTAYGADVAVAQAAVERFTTALKESDMAKIAEAEKEAVIKAAQERVEAVRHMDYATRMERIQNLEAYVAANKEALEKVLAANKILQDELKALELSKLYELRRWERDASNVWMQIDQIAVKSLDSTADALTELCLKGKADFRALAQSVIFDITRMMIKMQMAQALSFLFPGFAVPMIGGGGGGVPSGTYIQNVPGTMSATYLQSGGEITKTGWAKVHKGETFSGVGGGGIGGNLDVHIHNEGQEKFEVSRAEQYWAGDQRVVDIFITRAQTDGRLRRAIKSAVK